MGFHKVFIIKSKFYFFTEFLRMERKMKNTRIQTVASSLSLWILKLFDGSSKIEIKLGENV